MRTVLVVEDEPKIRELLRGYLERAGLSVVTTGSGAEAITSVAAARPDLVVLDLRLPDVPGEEVAREIRAFGSTPILMLTAKAGEDDRIRGLELGADDYVAKPFSPGRWCCACRRSCGGPLPRSATTEASVNRSAVAGWCWTPPATSLWSTTSRWT